MLDPEAPVLAALAGLRIEYERLECDPEAADTAVFCARYGIPPERSANTILVASKKEPKVYAACVVLAATSLDVNHAVRSLLGVSRLSFASAEETVAVTGMLVGGGGARMRAGGCFSRLVPPRTTETLGVPPRRAGSLALPSRWRTA